VVSGLEHASTASQRSLTQVLAEKRVNLEGDAGHGKERIGADNIQSFRGHDLRNGNSEKSETKDSQDANIDSPIEGGVWNLPEGFIIVYVSPMDVRERPVIHKSLVSLFYIFNRPALTSMPAA
jgi:hypothetical protein